MKIVIVGYGSIGKRHLQNLVSLVKAGLISVPVESITLVESERNRREKAAKDFGFIVRDSLSEALNQKQDIVFICTPSDMHIPLAQQAAEEGCHLFIEKPLSTSLEGVRELMAVLNRTRKNCLVACNMWFHPSVKKLRDILSSGKLGKPLLFRSYWGHHVAQWHPGKDLRKHYSLNQDQGGGTLFDVGAHEFFYVPRLLGEIEYAKTDLGPLGFLDTNVDDYSHTMVRLKNGLAGSFCFNFMDRCRRRGLEIIGEKATVIWRSEGRNPSRERIIIYTGNGPWNEIPMENSANIMYEETLKHFFNCVAKGEKPVQSLASAENILQIILSLKSKREYALSERPY